MNDERGATTARRHQKADCQSSIVAAAISNNLSVARTTMVMRASVSVALLLCCAAAFELSQHGQFRKAPAVSVRRIGRTIDSNSFLSSSSRSLHPRFTTRTQLWLSGEWWDTSHRRSSKKSNRRIHQQQPADDPTRRTQYDNDRRTNDQQPLAVERNSVVDVNYYVPGTTDHYNVRRDEEDRKVVHNEAPPQHYPNGEPGMLNNKNNNSTPSLSSKKRPSPSSNTRPTTRSKNSNQKIFSFQYQSEIYQIVLDVDPALRHEYHANAQRQYLYDSSTAPPNNWQEDFYRMFLSHPDDSHIVEQLLQELIRVTDTNDHDMLVEVVVAFVQQAIAYNWDTFHRIEQCSTLYPYETLHDQTGVCADKSILLARLLVELGYDCVFFAFDAANHIAVGVRVPRGMDDYNSGYAYIETTSCGPIGRIPTKLVGNVHLDEMPHIHRITNGGRVFERICRNKQMEQEQERKYGKEYFFLGPEQKQLKRDMVMLEQEIQHLDQTMDNCQSKTNLTEDQYHECQRLVDEHNRRVELYNAMAALFNTLNNNNDRSLSRPKA